MVEGLTLPPELILQVLWRSNVLVHDNSGIYGYLPEQCSVLFKHWERTEDFTIFKLKFTLRDNASRNQNMSGKPAQHFLRRSVTLQIRSVSFPQSDVLIADRLNPTLARQHCLYRAT